MSQNIIFTSEQCSMSYNDTHTPDWHTVEYSGWKDDDGNPIFDVKCECCQANGAFAFSYVE